MTLRLSTMFKFDRMPFCLPVQKVLLGPRLGIGPGRGPLDICPSLSREVPRSRALSPKKAPKPPYRTELRSRVNSFERLQTGRNEDKRSQ